VTGLWFSLGPPVSLTNKTNRDNITEILLKMALKHHKPTNPPNSQLLVLQDINSAFDPTNSQLLVLQDINSAFDPKLNNCCCSQTHYYVISE
jgi:hypothetical protein